MKISRIFTPIHTPSIEEGPKQTKESRLAKKLLKEEKRSSFSMQDHAVKTVDVKTSLIKKLVYPLVGFLKATVHAKKNVTELARATSAVSLQGLAPQRPTSSKINELAKETLRGHKKAPPLKGRASEPVSPLFVPRKKS